MHVIVATDGSKQSLAAAKHLKSFADPEKVTEISVVAVVRPLAAVAFADELSPVDKQRADLEAGGQSASEAEIRAKLDDLLSQAVTEIQQGR